MVSKNFIFHDAVGGQSGLGSKGLAEPVIMMVYGRNIALSFKDMKHQEDFLFDEDHSGCFSCGNGSQSEKWNFIADKKNAQAIS